MIFDVPDQEPRNYSPKVNNAKHNFSYFTSTKVRQSYIAQACMLEHQYVVEIGEILTLIPAVFPGLKT